MLLVERHAENCCMVGAGALKSACGTLPIAHMLDNWCGDRGTIIADEYHKRGCFQHR